MHDIICTINIHLFLPCTNVNGFEKRDQFAQIADFELVVLCQSTVDGLSVALCCASIAAPVPEICSLKV